MSPESLIIIYAGLAVGASFLCSILEAVLLALALVFVIPSDQLFALRFAGSDQIFFVEMQHCQLFEHLWAQ